MKLPEIEINNRILVDAIKRNTEKLDPDDVIKIEIDISSTENCKDTIIKIRTYPKKEEDLFHQFFETGQKLKISFD